MKSKLKEKNNEILLSIGMIVKNEEKHLENCMKALMPLRQQIKSELIIVDTGSTDRTIEIAKKYADKFYTFEWINDFSAARNYGLERAEGKWFMFLDADEYFDEDISEIVDFFKYPALYEKYNSASYVIRNYSDSTKKNYTDFLGSRMAKRADGVKFNDPIHEWLPMHRPHGYFGTIVHHFGYAYKNKREQDLKSDRNMQPLLEEYEKNPENSRILCHISSSCRYEEREKYLKEWLKVCRAGKGGFYRNHCYKAYIGYDAYNKKYDEAIELYNEYLKLDYIDDSVCTIQIYMTIALVYYVQDKFKESYDVYEKYFEIYRRYRNNEVSLTELLGGDVSGISDSEYQESIIYYSDCLFQMNRENEAIERLSELNVKKLNFANLAKYSNIIAKSLRKSSSFKYAADFYAKVLETGDTDKIDITNKQLSEFYYENPDKRQDFAKEFVDINSDDAFVTIMKICAEKDKSKAADMIYHSLKSVTCWNDGYCEIVWLAMKNNADVSVLIDIMNNEQIDECFKTLALRHDDYAETVLEFADIDKFTFSIKALLWIVSAMEKAVIVSKELTDNQKHDLYYNFISVLSDYVFNIYNPELFNENDIEILPSLHKFGYYMGCAMMAINEDNKIGYIRLIKKALKNNENMRELVEFLLEEFSADLK